MSEPTGADGAILEALDVAMSHAGGKPLELLAKYREECVKAERERAALEVEATYLRMAMRTEHLRGDGCYENQFCRDELRELVVKLRGAQ